jgi:hypothetical protein
VAAEATDGAKAVAASTARVMGSLIPGRTRRPAQRLAG